MTLLRKAINLFVPFALILKKFSTSTSMPDALKDNPELDFSKAEPSAHQETSHILFEVKYITHQTALTEVSAITYDSKRKR